MDRGEVRLRKKKRSKRYRDEFGHTPLSADEKIPWKCERLVIGTGAQGALPVMPAVLEEAERRGGGGTSVRTKEEIQTFRDAGAATHTRAPLACCGNVTR